MNYGPAYATGSALFYEIYWMYYVEVVSTHPFLSWSVSGSRFFNDA